MNRILISLLVCVIISAPSFATGLEASWDILDTDTVKTYAYTFTATGLSEADSAVTDIMVGMPEEGAKMVFSATCSDPKWYVYLESVGCEESVWGMVGGELVNGQSLTMWLATGSDVPTLYEMPSGSTSNWGYYAAHSLLPGGSILPVPGPVPEPSSLLALFGGLAGVGGIAIKRRRR